MLTWEASQHKVKFARFRQCLKNDKETTIRTILELLFASALVAGYAGSAGAATFDFSFLASGVSVGQGSFSFPDADLSQPVVTQFFPPFQGPSTEDFTSFDLTADGYTFTLADFYTGFYIPSSNNFEIDELAPDGFSVVLNAPTIVYFHSEQMNFEVTAFYFDPCYFLAECGPAYPVVFEGYTLDLLAPYTAGGPQDVVYGVHFDTILITPATSVAEPGSASLLLISLAGLVLLARCKGLRPKLAG